MMKTDSFILFDGVCNLCNSSVQFILQRDKRQRFRFASLQSEPGQALLKDLGLSSENFRSIVLVEGRRHYLKSSAALRIARGLGGLWPLAFVLIAVPPFIRNAAYDFVAANRYHWFGKSEACWLPSPDLKSRFLS